jgi:hypothetical protein
MLQYLRCSPKQALHARSGTVRQCRGEIEMKMQTVSAVDDVSRMRLHLVQIDNPATFVLPAAVSRASIREDTAEITPRRLPLEPATGSSSLRLRQFSIEDPPM